MVLINDLVGCWVEVHTGLIFFHLHIKKLYIKYLVVWNGIYRSSNA